MESSICSVGRYELSQPGLAAELEGPAQWTPSTSTLLDSGQFFAYGSQMPKWRRTLNTLCSKTLQLNLFGLWKGMFQTCHLPTTKCKASPAGSANHPANHLPSVLELGRNGANSWKTAEPRMQLLHQCLTCPSSPGSLLYPLSLSGGQNQQPC